MNESIDPYQEDYNNVWLIAHAAQLAGVKTKLIPIDEIIFNEDTKSWSDADGKPINNLFKLYPWEDLVTDSESGYDKLLFAYHGSIRRWVEPAWKMFLSNKLLLAALWEMYPNHPNLVPAYAGRSGGLTNWRRRMSISFMPPRASSCTSSTFPRPCILASCSPPTTRCWVCGW